jgi:hypothetical protein
VLAAVGVFPWFVALAVLTLPTTLHTARTTKTEARHALHLLGDT